MIRNLHATSPVSTHVQQQTTILHRKTLLWWLMYSLLFLVLYIVGCTNRSGPLSSWCIWVCDVWQGVQNRRRWQSRRLRKTVSWLTSLAWRCINFIIIALNQLYYSLFFSCGICMYNKVGFKPAWYFFITLSRLSIITNS